MAINWGDDEDPVGGKKYIRRFLSGSYDPEDLDRGFVWRTSPDGGEYWSDLYHDLREGQSPSQEHLDKLLVYLMVE